MLAIPLLSIGLFVGRGVCCVLCHVVRLSCVVQVLLHQVSRLDLGSSRLESNARRDTTAKLNTLSNLEKVRVHVWCQKLAGFSTPSANPAPLCSNIAHRHLLPTCVTKAKGRMVTHPPQRYFWWTLVSSGHLPKESRTDSLSPLTYIFFNKYP